MVLSTHCPSMRHPTAPASQWPVRRHSPSTPREHRPWPSSPCVIQPLLPSGHSGVPSPVSGLLLSSHPAPRTVPELGAHLPLLGQLGQHAASRKPSRVAQALVLPAGASSSVTRAGAGPRWEISKAWSRTGAEMPGGRCHLGCGGVCRAAMGVAGKNPGLVPPPLPAVAGRADAAEGLPRAAHQLRAQDHEDHQVPRLGGGLPGEGAAHPGPGAGRPEDVHPPLLRVPGVLPSVHVSGDVTGSPAEPGLGRACPGGDPVLRLRLGQAEPWRLQRGSLGRSRSAPCPSRSRWSCSQSTLWWPRRTPWTRRKPS